MTGVSVPWQGTLPSDSLLLPEGMERGVPPPVSKRCVESSVSKHLLPAARGAALLCVSCWLMLGEFRHNVLGGLRQGFKPWLDD